MSEAPGPWQADGPRQPHSSNNAFWIVRRHKPGNPFNEQVVCTRRGTKRFSSKDKADAWADKLNNERSK